MLKGELCLRIILCKCMPQEGGNGTHNYCYRIWENTIVQGWNVTIPTVLNSGDQISGEGGVRILGIGHGWNVGGILVYISSVGVSEVQSCQN